MQNPTHHTFTSLLHEQVAACLLRAEDHFKRPFPCDSVRLDIRGMTAGQYRHQRRGRTFHAPELRFNPDLLQRYGQIFIEEVVPHECAHLVAYAQFGLNIRPHGAEWKMVMADLYGRSPQVKHNFDVARPIRPQVEYTCACPDRTHFLSTIRHNKIQRGAMRYLCRVCKSDLRAV